MLDVDVTHVPLHGEQERGHFHACYDNYCYLPLYVFAGQDLLACVLRPSNRDPASVVSALVKRLLVPLRCAWPKTKIIVRADSGFCRPRVLRRLERWGVQAAQRANPRFIVTDLRGSAKALYERRYCARREAENRIKEAQLDLFGRRASWPGWRSCRAAAWWVCREALLPGRHLAAEVRGLPRSSLPTSL